MLIGKDLIISIQIPISRPASGILQHVLLPNLRRFHDPARARPHCSRLHRRVHRRRASRGRHPGRRGGVAQLGLRRHLRPRLLLPDGRRRVVGRALRRLVPVRGEGVVPRGDQQVG